MRLYKRYIDNSNQVAKAPPPGSRYDFNSGQIVTNLEEENGPIELDESDDKRLAGILNEIADNVQDEIKMEADYPSKNRNKKLAILDMNVWMNNENKIVYQHYEKQVASKQVISAQSAQSVACKKSVHVQALVRRILNTSTHLDWDDSFVPILNDYMVRMRLAGYTAKALLSLKAAFKCFHGPHKLS